MRKKKKKKKEEARRPAENQNFCIHARVPPDTHPFLSTRILHTRNTPFLRAIFLPSFLPYSSPLSLSRASRNSLSLFLSSWRIIMVTILGMRGKQAVIFHRNELFSGIFLPSVVLLWLPRRDKMGREFFGPRDAKHGFDRAQAARRY